MDTLTVGMLNMEKNYLKRGDLEIILSKLRNHKVHLTPNVLSYENGIHKLCDQFLSSYCWVICRHVSCYSDLALSGYCKDLVTQPGSHIKILLTSEV